MNPLTKISELVFFSYCGMSNCQYYSISLADSYVKFKEEQFDTFWTNRKSTLRGGGCVNFNKKKKQNGDGKKQIVQQNMNVEEIKLVLGQYVNKHGLGTLFLELQNCDNDCVVYSFQIITICLDLLQQFDRKLIDLENMYHLIINVKENIDHNLRKEKDYKWVNEFQFYFHLLEQSIEELRKLNERQNQSNLLLFINFQQRDLNQNQQESFWSDLMNLNQEGDLNKYETYYFYQMFQRKLIQSIYLENENNFNRQIKLLQDFYDKFVNPEDQLYNQDKQMIWILTQLNLIIRECSDKQQGINNKLKDFQQKLNLKLPEDQRFFYSFRKYKDEKKFEKIKKWIVFHLIILSKIYENEQHIMEILDKSAKEFQCKEQNQNVNDLWAQKKKRFFPNNESTTPPIEKPSYKNQLNHICQKKLNKYKESRKQENQDFIKLKVSIKQPTQEMYYDSSQCQEFLQNQEKDILWIFGKAKCGKTTLIKQMIHDLWQNYQDQISNWIPIYILLPSIEQIVNINEVLKKCLDQKPFGFTDIQIQDFINAVDNDQEYLLFVLDGYEQMSYGFQENNSIRMLGFDRQKKNIKIIISTRNSFFYKFQERERQNLELRMIQMEIKEFDEEQKKQHITNCLNQEIFKKFQNSKIKIELKQLNIEIDFHDGKIELQQSTIKNLTEQTNIKLKEIIKETLFETEQLNCLQKKYFINCFSFNYQFNILMNLIQKIKTQRPLSYKSSSSKYFKSMKQIQKMEESREKYLNDKMSESSSTFQENLQNPFEYQFDPREINKMFTSIFEDQKINLYKCLRNTLNENKVQYAHVLIQSISNPYFTIYQYINYLFRQYSQDANNKKYLYQLSKEQKEVKKAILAISIKKAIEMSNDQNRDQQKQNDQEKLTEMRYCLLEIQNSNYRFMDQIFQDFFVAKYIIKLIKGFRPNQILSDSFFNNQIFNLKNTNYEGVVALLKDQLLRIDQIYQKLIELINLSKNEQFKRASSNSLYLLSILNLNLEKVNLDEIHIADISIEGLSFYKASIRYSHWENIKINQCNFNQADLSGAQFKNVDIRENPKIHVRDGVQQLQFSSDNKYIGILYYNTIIIQKLEDNSQIQLRLEGFGSFNYFSFQRDSSRLAISTVFNQENVEKYPAVEIIDFQEFFNSSNQYQSKDQLIKNLKNQKLYYDFCCNAFSFLNEKKLCCGFKNNQLILWNFTKGQNNYDVINTFQQQILKIALDYKKSSLDYKGNSQDYKNQTMAIQFVDKTVKIFNITRANDGSKYKSQPKKGWENKNLILSSCQNFLAIQNNDDLVIYNWQLDEKKKYKISSQVYKINQFHISQNLNKLLIVKSKEIEWLDQDRFILQRLQDNSQSSISPDGTQLAICQDNKISIIWQDKNKLNLSNRIVYQEIQKAQYSPDGQYIVIEFQDKTIFYDFDDFEISLQLEKVNFLVFSKDFFALSSDQGVKIFGFQDRELLEWLPFQTKKILFCFASQRLAILDNQICIYDVVESQKNQKKLLEKINIVIDYHPKIIIAISQNNDYLSIAQGGQFFLFKNSILQEQQKNQGNQNEIILSMCFTFYNEQNLLATRSRKGSSHIFRIINVSGIKIVSEWEVKDQINDNDNYQNRCQFLIIQDKLYIISNQKNLIILSQIIMFLENQKIEEPQHIKLQQQMLGDSNTVADYLCFSFSITQNLNFIASCYSNNNQLKDGITTIIFWQQDDKQIYKQIFTITKTGGSNLFILQKEEKQCIWLLSYINDLDSSKIQIQQITTDGVINISKEINSQKPISSITFSSVFQHLLINHLPNGFSLYEIKELDQSQLLCYCEQTQMPVYFTQNDYAIYFFQQSIVIRRVDQFIKYLKYYSKGIIIDQNVGLCFNNNLFYFNNEQKIIYEYSDIGVQEIIYENVEQQIITCSQFSPNGNIVVFTYVKNSKQFSRILQKKMDKYEQLQEIQFDSNIYGIKILTNNSFIVLTNKILIYKKNMVGEATSFQIQSLHSPDIFLNPEQSIKQISVHPNGNDFLVITKGGQIQVYLQDEEQYCLKKTISDQIQFEAKDCKIKNIRVDNPKIKVLFQQKGAIDESMQEYKKL
ncbi:unnamed protein product [Paramecium sonneborni]|uniref:NACHT domain-containing protein n=1 Tax=Paramecium sonneborni TaxID=65129 RepID=A0A8S1QZ66_9CILI|nr:unnamed protein product [Paramecium sonneborni]